MFWCCSGTSHGPRNCCPVSMSPCGVNKPQWVNAVMLPADWKRLKPINSFWKPVTHCGYTVKVTYQSSKLMPMSTANKHQYQPQRFVLYLQPTCSTTRYIRYGIFIHTRPESGVQKKTCKVRHKHDWYLRKFHGLAVNKSSNGGYQIFIVIGFFISVLAT